MIIICNDNDNNNDQNKGNNKGRTLLNGGTTILDI